MGNDKLAIENDIPMAYLKYGEITGQIIDAAFRVHITPGCGFQEVSHHPIKSKKSH